ncbi:Spo0B domain-containing protein [Paenibacillus sp. YYML68]|uniref:Spo0B domain-containing protein n=1 Tax=Paenibacillus sp. YYML68 TaxID=2909250 RepID=UPI002493CF3A|nr:Spo0B domain-containing protein [Paenibacillus sp. YYML68]
MTSNGKEDQYQQSAAVKPGSTPDANETARDTSQQDLRLLRLFNHYRHDWMNDIQILMSYVQLKKYDKLPPMMEKIKDRVQQESMISNLGLPSLVVYLLTFKTEVKELQLKVRMNEEVRLQSFADADKLVQIVKDVLELYKREAQGAPECVDNMLSLTWSKPEERLQLDFRYEGGCKLERVQAQGELLARQWKQHGIGLDTLYGEGCIDWTIIWTAGRN